MPQHAIPAEAAVNHPAAATAADTTIPAAESSDWRADLVALRASGTLDDAQDTDLHRLLAEHEAEVRERMPVLLDAFQQDLSAHGADAAKQALTAALQAIKDRQRDETLRMLESAGADVSVLRR